MNMKKLAIAFSILVMLPVVAAAQKPLTFTASENVTYDDNIYLTKDDTKGSVISTTRVGAQYAANIPGSGLELSANALVGYNAYTEKPSTNNYWDTLAGVQLQNDYMKLGDRFIYTSDPANSALTDRAKRVQNVGYLALKTSTEKTFGLGITAEDIFDRYMKSAWDSLNRNRVNLGAQAFYNVSPKTNFFVEYVYSDIHYADNDVNNSTGGSVGLGVNGQLASKVTGTAKVTYDMRDYKNDLAGAKNYNDMVGYLAALEWQPTEQNVIKLSGQRQMEETTAYVGNPNRYFADTLVSLYGSQKIYDKWTASLTLSWENMNYSREYSDGTKRNDDLWSVRPALDYQFEKWLSAGVWYQFRTRDSNEDWAKYDRNQFGIYAKALF